MSAARSGQSLFAKLGATTLTAAAPLVTPGNTSSPADSVLQHVNSTTAQTEKKTENKTIAPPPAPLLTGQDALIEPDLLELEPAAITETLTTPRQLSTNDKSMRSVHLTIAPRQHPCAPKNNLLTVPTPTKGNRKTHT